MPINDLSSVQNEWTILIENLKRTPHRSHPFFRSATFRLESFWEERVKVMEDTVAVALLCALARALMTYSTTRTIETPFVQLLPEVLLASRSPFGFLAEVEYNAAGKPYLKSHAVTNIYKRDFGRHDILTGLEFDNLDTLNGAMLTSRRPVVANDPENDPRRGGVPFGHAKLSAFLGLPFLVSGELIGAVALGNRPGGYSEAEVMLLEPLCEVGGLMIAAYRSERITD